MSINALSSIIPPPPPLRNPGDQAIVRTQHNDVDISVQHKPLELLYKTAIDKLNSQLEAELGPDAIGKAAQSGMDFSPEAVAERIVSFATSFYASYAERHGDESQEDQLNGFMDLVGGAIKQGFEEAKEILEGLQVFEGEIADNANKTYDLMQQKLEAFAEQMRSNFSAQEDATNIT